MNVEASKNLGAVKDLAWQATESELEHSWVWSLLP